MVGDGMLALLSRAFAATGEPIDDTQSYVHFKIHHLLSQPTTRCGADISAYCGNLQYFQNAGVKLAICTNKQEAATHHLLEQWI